MASTRKCCWQNPCLPAVGVAGGVECCRPVPQLASQHAAGFTSCCTAGLSCSLSSGPGQRSSRIRA